MSDEANKTLQKHFNEWLTTNSRYIPPPAQEQPILKHGPIATPIRLITDYLSNPASPPDGTYVHIRPIKSLNKTIQKIFWELVEQEQFVHERPKTDTSGKSPAELSAIRENISKYKDWQNYAGQYLYRINEYRLDLHELILKHIPKEYHGEHGYLSVRLLDALENPREFVRDLIAIFADRGDKNQHQQPLFANLNRAIQGHRNDLLEHKKTGYNPITHPNKDRAKVVHDYFHNTSLHQLFLAPLNFEIPWHEKHGLIVAPTGAGKSQLLEALIWGFLQDPDWPSIVIIDSKGGYKSLFERISRLEIFHPDVGNHMGRLTLIDPLDEPKLGLFASKDKSSHVQTALTDLFRAWPGAGDFTDLQKRIINHLVPLILAMNGNLTDALHAIDDPHQEEFQKVFPQLSPETQEFWQNYRPKDYSQSLPGLKGRIDLIRSTPLLGNMFNARENNLDLFDEMNTGKVVLISTSQAVLSKDLSAVLGSYFVAQAFSAGVRRGKERHPTYLIVDEALALLNDVTEDNFITLREYNVRCIYAVQSAKRVATKGLWQAIGGGTEVKFAAGLEGGEISMMQEYMGRNCSVDFLYEQQKDRAHDPAQFVRFGCSVKGVTHDDPVSLRIPTGVLDKQGFMSDVAYDRLRDINRAWLTEGPDENDPASQPSPESKSDPTKPTTSY